jgi:hypothetical protein
MAFDSSILKEVPSPDLRFVGIRDVNRQFYLENGSEGIGKLHQEGIGREKGGDECVARISVVTDLNIEKGTDGEGTGIGQATERQRKVHWQSD